MGWLIVPVMIWTTLLYRNWPTGIRVVTDRSELRQMKNSPRYYTLANRWGTKRGMAHCSTGVLASPFMRAALVIEVDPAAVTTSRIRPARYYSNYVNGYFSRLIPARPSPVWVVPTRHPEALRKALGAVSGHREPADDRTSPEAELGRAN